MAYPALLTTLQEAMLHLCLTYNPLELHGAKITYSRTYLCRIRNQMQIRLATIDDLDRLQAIAKTTFSETFANLNSKENMRKYLNEALSSEKLRKELLHEHSSFYLAIENDKPIGYLKLNEGTAQSELQHSDSLEIERIYVLKCHHGTRIGKALLDHALAIARAKEKISVWLGVWERNHRAIAFYRKHGFVEFGTHIFRLGDEDQLDILMKMIPR